MNDFKFSITFTLLFFILAEKVVFLLQEPSYSRSFLALCNIIILIVCFCLGIFFFWRTRFLEKKPALIHSDTPLSIYEIVLIGVIAVVLSISLFFNLTKKSLDWDDIALYDARAKFLENGVTFSQMPNLSKNDPKNYYYYLLYPPFTSETHFLWRQLGTGISISTLYAFSLIFLGLGIFVILGPRSGRTIALITALLVITQKDIFRISLIAYTNLPYTLYLSLGILLLYSFLGTKKKWEFLFGVLLVALSQWIRFLEPSWLPIFIAFSLASLKLFKLKKSMQLSLIFIIVCASEYLAWKYFVQSSSINQTIFQTSFMNYFEPVLGVFTGSLRNVATFFVGAWGLPLVIHVTALIIAVRKGRALPNKGELTGEIFLKLCIFLSISMYLAGMYFISFQTSWWQDMGGSMIRSSTFLLPLSIYLLVKQAYDYLKVS